MTTRYETRKVIGAWQVHDTEQNDLMLCVCRDEVSAGCITEALNIASEYWDKILDRPVKEISEY